MTGEHPPPRLPLPVAAAPATRIFVVDDSSTFRAAVEAVIRAAGCEPMGWAASARDAWSQLSAVLPPGQPDLVLVDVQLPDASGTDLAFALAGRLGLRVALVSTLAESDLPATPAACGAIAFVSKSALDPSTVAKLARPRALAGVRVPLCPPMPPSVPESATCRFRRLPLLHVWWPRRWRSAGWRS